MITCLSTLDFFFFYVRPTIASGSPGERKGSANKLSPGPGLWFQPSVRRWLGGHGNTKRQGPCVNKEQWLHTMGACLQTTLLTDTRTKGPVNGKEARAHRHAHTQKRIEQFVVTHKADVWWMLLCLYTQRHKQRSCPRGNKHSTMEWSLRAVQTQSTRESLWQTHQQSVRLTHSLLLPQPFMHAEAGKSNLQMWILCHKCVCMTGCEEQRFCFTTLVSTYKDTGWMMFGFCHEQTLCVTFRCLYIDARQCSYLRTKFNQNLSL